MAKNKKIKSYGCKHYGHCNNDLESLCDDSHCAHKNCNHDTCLIKKKHNKKHSGSCTNIQKPCQTCRRYGF